MTSLTTNAASQGIGAETKMSQSSQSPERRGPVHLDPALTAAVDEVPRPYQVAACTRSIERNTIVVLPTNCGKTLIAVLLLRRLLPEVKARGRKICFIAPIRALLLQQFEYVKHRLPARAAAAATFTGDTVITTKAGNHSIDNWSEEDWKGELKKCDVLFLIPEILCQALLKASLHSSLFDLIIFDECHHCNDGHPMNRICENLRDQEYRGRILGLTASPMKKKKGSLEAAIATLERNMNCSVFTPEKLVTAKPLLVFLRHDENCLRLHSHFRWLEGIYDKLRRCCSLHHLRAAQLTLHLSEEQFEMGLLEAPQRVLPTVGWVACKQLELTLELLGQLLQVLCDNGLAAGLCVVASTLSDQTHTWAGVGARSRTAQHHSLNKRLGKVDVLQFKKLHVELATSRDLASLVDGPAVCFSALLSTLAFFAVSLGPSVCARAKSLIRDRFLALRGCTVTNDAILNVLDNVMVQGGAASAATITTTFADAAGVSDVVVAKQALAGAYKILFDSIPDATLISSIFALPTGAMPPTLEPVFVAEPLPFDACQPFSHMNNMAADVTAQDQVAPFPMCSRKLSAFFRLWLMLPEQVLKRRQKKIVFVKTRLTALSLCDLMRTVTTSKSFASLAAPSGGPFTAAEVLLGSSDIKEQSAVLSRFKQGDSNILFSTDVAEEGLDISTCRMVMHFDAPPSTKSLIQRHGRARDAKSLVVFIADRGDAGRNDLADVSGLLDQQRQLELQTSTPVDDNVSWEPAREKKMPPSQAVSLLVQFCQLLPRDIYYDPTPVFDFAEIEEDGPAAPLDVASLSSITASMFGPAAKNKLFVCSILLPASIRPEIRCVVGALCRSKSEAKGDACVACLENLRQHGELDASYRFAPGGVTKNSRKSSRLRVMAEALSEMRRRESLAGSPGQAESTEPREQEEETEEEEEEEEGGAGEHDEPILGMQGQEPDSRDQSDRWPYDPKVVPDCLKCDPSSTAEELFFYCLRDVAPAVNTAVSSSVAVVLEALAGLSIAYLRPLRDAVVEQPLSFSFQTIPLSATLELMGSRRVSPAELALLQSFHLSLYCWTALSDEATEALPWSDGKWTQSSGGSYNIVFPSPPPGLGMSDPQYLAAFLPACLAEAQALVRNLARYRSDNYDGEAAQHKEFYEPGDLGEQADAPEAGCETGYIFASGSYDLWVPTDNSTPPSASASASAASSSPPLPLFEAKHVSSRLSLTNLIKKRELLRPASERDGWRRDFYSRESCRWMGKAKWLHWGLAAPSVLHRINSLCLALEAHECILRHIEDAELPLPLSPVPPARMLEALTLSRCGEDVSLERLELLGDTLFKFFVSVDLYRRNPAAREGELTQKRCDWISNIFQACTAIEAGLDRFLRATPLAVGKRLLAKPPGLLGGGGGAEGSLWNLKLTASKAALHRAGPLPLSVRLPVPLDLDPAPLSPPLDDVAWGADEEGPGQGAFFEGEEQDEEGEEQEEEEQEEEGHEQNLGASGTTIKLKCLADMMEAILGAFYRTGNLEDALAVMRGLHMLPGPELTPAALAALHTDAAAAGEGPANWVVPREIVIEPSPAAESVRIPENFPEHLRRLVLDGGEATPDRPAPGLSRLADAQQKLDYTFRNPALLSTALTHCSVHHQPSNQRLEWLGDAVLDLVVVDFLYTKYPSADEGRLSALKQAAACNARLATCTVRLGLHTLLQHRSPVLATHLAGIDGTVAEGMLVTSPCVPLSCVKVLADTFEAIVGAVYIDSVERQGLGAVFDIVLHLKLLDPVLGHV